MHRYRPEFPVHHRASGKSHSFRQTPRTDYTLLLLIRFVCSNNPPSVIQNSLRHSGIYSEWLSLQSWASCENNWSPNLLQNRWILLHLSVIREQLDPGEAGFQNQPVLWQLLSARLDFLQYQAHWDLKLQ